jgi:hypothetical protein
MQLVILISFTTPDKRDGVLPLVMNRSVDTVTSQLAQTVVLLVYVIML